MSATAGEVRVLCVEDDPTFALIVRDALAAATVVRYSLELCDTLAGARARLAESRFDALLLDLNLPDSRGLDTLRTLHAAAPALPIVVLTVLDDEAVGMEAVAHGADEYLVKGHFDARTLGRTVHYAIERQRARRKLEAASRAKDEFLALVAHEFRTPLNAMLGWTELLQLADVDASRARKAAEVIERNAQALASLIEDLLDVARIETGNMRMSARPCHLPSVIEDALDTVRLACTAKRIALGVALEPPPAPVIGDPQRLQQMMWNLLSNAVKFTAEEGAVHVTLRHEDAHALIEVRDSGRGIAPDLLPQVFERFVQANALSERKGGLGLGLALVREIAELHGGTVAAESAGRDRGASFRVRLPLALDLAYRDEDEAPLRGLRVGLVPDAGDEREALKLLLESSGATTLIAPSLVELASREQTPHLVLADAGPAGPGREQVVEEVARAQRGALRGVPIVALTASESEREARALRDAGFAQCLVKPLRSDALLPLLAALAGRRGGRRWSDRR